MEMGRFFQLMDAQPFRPFDVDLVNGRCVKIDHPENVHIFPARHRVKEILVYYPGTDDYSIIFPEGITALHVHDGGDGDGAS